MSWLTVFAQVQIHHRASDCESNNGFCPDWIVKNFGDRYVDPFFRHLELVVISVLVGFVIAFALGIVAHRRRWLVGPVVGLPASSTRSPRWRRSCCWSRSPASGCSPR